METYGAWTVVRAGRKCLVRCSCGTESDVLKSDLRAGKSRRCRACNFAEKKGKPRPEVRSHGLADTPTMTSWTEMKRRCYSAHRKEFVNYGGRGIYVCERWLESFANFVADMGIRPIGTTLERVDNDGPYSPDNCRWAVRSEQDANKQTSVRFMIDGQSMSVADITAAFGVGKHTFFNRVNTLGWPPERAAKQAVRGKG